MKTRGRRWEIVAYMLHLDIVLLGTDLSRFNSQLASMQYPRSGSLRTLTEKRWKSMTASSATFSLNSPLDT